MTGKVRNIFIALLRSSLWQTPLAEWSPLTPEEWDELFAEAQKHTLLGVIYDALPAGSGIPPQVALNWLMCVRSIEQTNGLLRAVADVQAKAWERRGIKAVLLKGQTVAKMYPRPEHRTSGDLDWYFATEGEWNIARVAAVENDCPPEMDSDGDIHYVLSGVVVEHHRRWNSASSARARTALDALDPLSPVGQLSMLSVHILKHALIGGIGLRQFCDLALAYKYYEGQYQREELLAVYEAAGLMEWNILVEGVLSDLLAAPGLQLAEGYEADIRAFEEMVLTDGNFGHHEMEGSFTRLCTMLKGLRYRRKFFRHFAPEEFNQRIFSLMKGRLNRSDS